MSTTHTAEYRMILKELGEGSNHSWALECYADSDTLPLTPSNGSLYIRLNKSTTEEQAKQVRDLLNNHVDCFTYLS